MDQDEARRFVVDNVSVRRQQVVMMKGLLVRHYDNSGSTMFEKAVQQVSPPKPANVVLHSNVDPVSTLRLFAEWIFMVGRRVRSLMGIGSLQCFTPWDFRPQQLLPRYRMDDYFTGKR